MEAGRRVSGSGFEFERCWHSAVIGLPGEQEA